MPGKIEPPRKKFRQAAFSENIGHCQSPSANLREIRNVGVDRHGVVGVVHHESGLGSGRLLYMLFLYIVDFHLVLLASLGIVGGKSRSLLECAIRHLGPLGF